MVVMLARQVLLGIALLGACAGAASAQVVRLRATATVEMHQDVRLGDMATVTAADPKKAEELANTVIVASVDKPQKIKAEAVLMALMAQRGAAVLGASFQMGGAAACELMLETTTPGTARAAALQRPAASVPTASRATARANEPVSLVTGPAPEESAPVVTAAVLPGKAAEQATGGAGAAGPTTLRKEIFAVVQQGLGLPEDDIKVTLDSISPLLDEPVTGKRKWQCRPLTRTFLGSVPFEAQLTEGGKVLAKLTVMAQVQQKQMVVVLKAPLGRRGVVVEDQVELRESWQDRKLPTLFANVKDVVGLEAQVDLAAGVQLDQRDFKPLMMAHRNDLVTVYYVAGSLEVQTQARALEDGKLHQTIALRNDGTGKDFTAYLVGKNKAVVGTLTAEQERRIREAE